MARSSKFRDFIIGKEVIFSYPEFKRTMLTAYLACMCMAVAVIYLILDTLNQVYYSWPAYIILFSIPAFSLWLIRKKMYLLAKILMMTAANLGVFFAAISDPFETGAFLYFIPAGIGSFAILEYRERLIGIALAGLTLCLFLVAIFGNLGSLLNIPRPSEFYIKLSLVFNYSLSLTVSVLMIYFLINLNRRSERELSEKEAFANLKNAELQKVNDELDRFVYSVSHDLRSPLSSILGLTDLARRSRDPQEIEQLLTMIRGRVKAQDHFINEIIDYSRNIRTEVIAEPVDLPVLIQGVWEMMKFSPNAEKINFIMRIPEHLKLITDKTRLSVILSNLIGNAIKYHDLTKENPFVEIGFHEASSALYVKDNGIGVMDEYQDKIFNMFYRASDRSTGSGLGLFITREAVQKLNGRIEVNSTYGVGSIFTVYLPVTSQGGYH